MSDAYVCVYRVYLEFASFNKIRVASKKMLANENVDISNSYNNTAIVSF